MTEDYKRTIGKVIATMGKLRTEVPERPQLHWMISFGSLLHILRDNGNMPDGEDIDFSIFYEDYDPKHLEAVFKAGGIYVKKKIINDVTKKPLYYTMVDYSTNIEICIFCWVKHNGIRWHTYDVALEGKKIPSKYVFKGVPEALFKETMDRPLVGTYRNVKIPKSYGALLDIWYPDFMTRRGGVSETKWKIEMKSCAQFKDRSYKKLSTLWYGDFFVDGKPVKK